MPMDGNMEYESHTFEEAFLARAKWTLKFVWWPKRCVFSNQWIWVKRAYCGVARWMGPGSDAVEVNWANRDDFLIWSLRRRRRNE